MSAITATPIPEIVGRARSLYESVRREPTTALLKAMDAGDVLIELKSACRHGEWSKRRAETSIPESTASLYVRLARARERILAAGCKSIRQAQQLLTGTRPRPKRSRVSDSESAPHDRYDEGYADGYRAGKADGRPTTSGPPAPPSAADLKWLIKLAHPDTNLDDKNALKATRVTQFLNACKEYVEGTASST